MVEMQKGRKGELSLVFTLIRAKKDRLIIDYSIQKHKILSSLPIHSEAHLGSFLHNSITWHHNFTAAQLVTLQPFFSAEQKGRHGTGEVPNTASDRGGIGVFTIGPLA